MPSSRYLAIRSLAFIHLALAPICSFGDDVARFGVVASQGGRYLARYGRGGIDFYRVEKAGLEFTAEAESNCPEQCVLAAAFSNRGDVCAFVFARMDWKAGKPHVTARNARSLWVELVSTRSGKRRFARRLPIVDDELFFDESFGVLWRRAPRKRTFPLDFPLFSDQPRIRFADDDSSFAVLMQAGTGLSVWNVEPPTLLWHIPTAVGDAVLTNDGHVRCVTWGHSKMSLWDSSDGRAWRRFDSLGRTPTQTWLSRNGTLLVSFPYDRNFVDLIGDFTDWKKRSVEGPSVGGSVAFPMSITSDMRKVMAMSIVVRPRTLLSCRMILKPESNKGLVARTLLPSTPVSHCFIGGRLYYTSLARNSEVNVHREDRVHFVSFSTYDLLSGRAVATDLQCFDVRSRETIPCVIQNGRRAENTLPKSDE